MKVLGLTGGIGMGKSTVATWLSQHGAAVVDTDILARTIVEPGQPALDEIRHAFGSDVISRDGALLRDRLAAAVFGDSTARQKLETILHPRIRQLWVEQVEKWRTEGIGLAVVAIPLLFETGAEDQFDLIMCVACTAATQRRRLEQRGWAAHEIDQRIAAQWTIDAKMAKADLVIWTEGGLDVLTAQLERIFSPRTADIGGFLPP